jgi:hypothetical protein
MRAKLIRVYQNIKQRCYNPNNRDYPKHGAKGIGLCPAWRNDLEAFLAEAPLPPEGWCALTLKDPKKDFSADNVYWRTRATKAKKKKKGRKQPVSDADILEILRLVHVEEFSTWDVALGYPLSPGQVFNIATGRAYRVPGYTYPARLKDHRTPEQIAAAAKLPELLLEFAAQKGVTTGQMWGALTRMRYQKKQEEK